MGINFRNINQYEIHLHSRDFTKTVKLAARYITHYTTNQKPDDDQHQLIDSNVLSFVTNETIYMEIVFVQPATKLDRHTLALLECPVCAETMISSIYQCKRGHSFCEMCTKKLARCPTCKQAMTNALNYALMAHSAQINHPCKNKKVGCTFEGLLPQLRKHEKACFRYDCPAKNCRFNGNKTQLLEHCMYYHEKEGGSVKWSLKTLNVTVTKVICAFGDVFKSSRRFTGNELLWCVEYCGRDEEAGEFCYTVEFELGAKRLVFSDVCRGVGDEASVFDDCMSVPYYQFAPFVSNGVCTNSVYVTRNENKVL